MKNKHQIVSFIVLVMLSACGDESEKINSTNQQDINSTSSQSEIEESIQEVSGLNDSVDATMIIIDTLEKINIIDTVIDNGGDIGFAKTDIVPVESEAITNAQADEITATLHTVNNSSPTDDIIPEEAAAMAIAQKMKGVVETKIDHLEWDALVRKNVSSSGLVNYQGFKNQKAQVQTYLEELSAKKPEKDWSKNEKLAYWINAYNAYTVKLIIDNYPTTSITKLKGGKPWDDKFITIEGEKYSLGQIENDILRKMNEPRIHFAINCASGSCPNLYNKAFLADKMSSQLKKVTNTFLNDTSKNNFSGKKIKISELFNWYAKDFNGGDIIAFINKHRTDQLDANIKIEYLEYDWSLNE